MIIFKVFSKTNIKIAKLIGILIIFYIFSFFMSISLSINTSKCVINVNIGQLNVKSNLNSELNLIHKSSKPRIFCIILTSRDALQTKAKVVYNTWARKCDNHKFVLKLPSRLKNSILNFSKFEIDEYDAYEINNLLEPPEFDEDGYDRLTDKMYLTYKYLYQKYDNYDWYLKADDDTFVFMNNLRKFISDKNSSLPVTYGYDFKLFVKNGYHSGGAGYLMSHEAFMRIGSKLNEDYYFCPYTSSEDVDVAKCFRMLDVYPNKSLDDLGRERFHLFNITTHYNGEIPKFLHRYASNPVKQGIDCCSDSSISFHYMKPNEIIMANEILENFENNVIFTFQSFVDKFLEKISNNSKIKN